MTCETVVSSLVAHRLARNPSFAESRNIVALSPLVDEREVGGGCPRDDAALSEASRHRILAYITFHPEQPDEGIALERSALGFVRQET